MNASKAKQGQLRGNSDARAFAVVPFENLFGAHVHISIMTSSIWPAVRAREIYLRTAAKHHFAAHPTKSTMAGPQTTFWRIAGMSYLEV
jgi:hypothetical protein